MIQEGVTTLGYCIVIMAVIQGFRCAKTMNLIQRRWRSILTKAEDFFETLRGQPLSHIWQGYGSAIFLEFGDLTPRLGRDGSIEGEMGAITVRIEWSWRIERSRSILIGSWGEQRRWAKIFSDLIGTKVTNLEVFGSLPEISISLSSGHRVVSFMTAEGQPSWAITLNSLSCKSLSVKRGHLFVEAG